MLHKLSMVAGMLVLVFAVQAQAAIVVDLNKPINDRPSYTLQEVKDAGGIVVGDKLFDEFRVTTTTQGGGVAPDITGIAVTGVNIASELGLRFNGGWTAGAGQIADSTIGFRVSIIEPNLSQGWLITDNSLFSTAMLSSNGGVASVIELVYEFDPQVVPPGNTFPNLPPNHPLAEKFILHDSNDGTVQTFDHQEFGGGFPEIWVVKDVIVNGSTASNGQAHISEFFQTFSQIPEPSSLMLVAGGVLMLIRRHRR